MVTCGAANSAALVLRNANENHPGGLANTSVAVGKNLMLHYNIVSAMQVLKQAMMPNLCQQHIYKTDYIRHTQRPF